MGRQQPVSTISARWQQLASSFQDRAYRHAFVSNHISRGLAFQIRAMRQARPWSQTELGERISAPQSAISQLENPNYGQFTLSTLKKLAEAFDVALIVTFAPFSEFISRLDNLSSESLEVPDFAHDPGLQDIDPIQLLAPVLSRAIPPVNMDPHTHVMTVASTKMSDFSLEPDNVLSMVTYLPHQVHTAFQLPMPMVSMTAQPDMENEDGRRSS